MLYFKFFFVKKKFLNLKILKKKFLNLFLKAFKRFGAKKFVLFFFTMLKMFREFLRYLLYKGFLKVYFLK